MLPTYDATTNALLSDDALALSPEALLAHNIVAEQVLQLTGTELTGDDAVQAANAIALQINYQVALPPEIWAVKVDQTGPLRTEYRDTLPPINGFAWAIVTVLLPELLTMVSGGWASTGPRR